MYRISLHFLLVHFLSSFFLFSHHHTYSLGPTIPIRPSLNALFATSAFDYRSVHLVVTPIFRDMRHHASTTPVGQGHRRRSMSIPTSGCFALTNQTFGLDRGIFHILFKFSCSYPFQIVPPNRLLVPVCLKRPKMIHCAFFTYPLLVQALHARFVLEDGSGEGHGAGPPLDGLHAERSGKNGGGSSCAWFTSAKETPSQYLRRDRWASRPSRLPIGACLV